MAIRLVEIDSKEVTIVNGVDGNPLKIPNGTSLSQAVDLRGFALKGILTPAAWTAAAISMQGSPDGQNFFPLVIDNSSTQTSLIATVATSEYYLLKTASGTYPFPMPRFIKIRSGTDGTPVNQGADRPFTLIVVPFGLGA
jgi:hypothetical protein